MGIKMKKLLSQILKFGVVGAFCFILDFIIFKTASSLLGLHYIPASILSFTISVIVNYILSMKFVFEGKEDMNKKAEFIIFVILSMIGLGLNTLIMYICMDGIYQNWPWLQNLIGEGTAESFSKIITAGVVMVYNFITRKIFLEKHEKRD